MLKNMITTGRICEYATAAQLSWHVQNCHLLGSLYSKANYEYQYGAGDKGKLLLIFY